ncbi:MAG: hypothetical protein IPN86_16640 [Saprospiraceae bacterium]|nr:hypothetical protein [Saprospiraceae bacterium]
MNINGQSQNSNFDIIVSHKSDAYPIYFKEVKRFNQQYINPTGYLISVRAKDTKAIQDLKEKIASWVKLNKPVQSLEQRLAYLEDKEGIKSTSYKFEAVNYKFSNTSNSSAKYPREKLKLLG